MFILFIAIFLESPRSMMTFRIHEWKKQGFKILKYHQTRFSLSLHFTLMIILLFALKLLKVFNPETYIIFADYCTMSRMFVGFPIFYISTYNVHFFCELTFLKDLDILNNFIIFYSHFWRFYCSRYKPFFILNQTSESHLLIPEFSGCHCSFYTQNIFV